MAIPARTTQSESEATVSPRGVVNFSEDVLREVGLEPGDRVWVRVVDGDQLVLTKRPEDIVAYFSGALTHLYPEPGDVGRFLDEERESWAEFDRRFDD